MKKQIITALLLCALAVQSTRPENFFLDNPILKAADNAGLFDMYIVEILKSRKDISNFVTGKYTWQGYKLTLKTTTGKQLSALIKNPEFIFGASYVVLSPEHPALLDITTAEYKNNVQAFIKTASSKTLLDRQNSHNYETCFTGAYIQHPTTNNPIPVFVSDYNIECFDSRTTHIHIGIPAHYQLDLNFARKHNLPVELVIVDFAYDSKEAAEQSIKQGVVYSRHNNQCEIINSGFLNGPLRKAIEQAIEYLKTHNQATEYSENLVYNLYGKKYSIDNLHSIEKQFQQEKKTLTPDQQLKFKIIMNYCHADFIDIVEKFLSSVKRTKDLMATLIAQSCELRKNKNSYMLQWSQHTSNEPERELFKKNITTFTIFSTFCTDLVHFLGDFATSCPHAREKLEQLKK